MRAMLLALVFLVSVSSAAAAEDCTLVKMASLPITADEFGRPLVPVTINGTERKFLVDTGGAFTGLSEAVVKELELHTTEIGSHEIYSASGKKITRYATVETMTIGISTAKSAHLMVFDAGGGADGTLGPDYLENFDLDFDFGAKALNLISPQHCKGKVVYWTPDYVDIPFRLSQSNHITVPMMLDGKKLLTLLDTGASDTFLSMASARNLFGLRDGSPELELLPDAKDTDLVRYRRRFETLSLDGVTVKRPLIYLHADAAEKTFRRNHNDKTQFNPETRIELEKQDLAVGMNILGKLHLYIAYKEKMVYVSGANAH